MLKESGNVMQFYDMVWAGGSIGISESEICME
jgi:hypothetical protein